MHDAKSNKKFCIYNKIINVIWVVNVNAEKIRNYYLIKLSYYSKKKEKRNTTIKKKKNK